MEKEVIVVEDAEFDKLALQWGYDLAYLRAKRDLQGFEPVEIGSLSKVTLGVHWMIIRKSRWEEIQEMGTTGLDED